MTFALRPLYAQATRQGNLPFVKIHGLDQRPENADAYAILKHMSEHTHHYSRVLGQGELQLQEISAWLQAARQALEHEGLAGISRHDLNEAFLKARLLATASRQRFAQANLRDLHDRVKEHWASKDGRLTNKLSDDFMGFKQPSASVVCLNINGTQAPPRPSAQHPPDFCSYVSARGKCAETPQPNSLFCDRHRCPIAHCTDFKSSSDIDCGAHQGARVVARLVIGDASPTGGEAALAQRGANLSDCVIPEMPYGTTVHLHTIATNPLHTIATNPLPPVATNPLPPNEMMVNGTMYWRVHCPQTR